MERNWGREIYETIAYCTSFETEEELLKNFIKEENVGLTDDDKFEINLNLDFYGHGNLKIK